MEGDTGGLPGEPGAAVYAWQQERGDGSASIPYLNQNQCMGSSGSP
jgi:hypothetical protein